jgi:hypothetical protein
MKLFNNRKQSICKYCMNCDYYSKKCPRIILISNKIRLQNYSFFTYLNLFLYICTKIVKHKFAINVFLFVILI